jgi:hypothetical protein
LQLISSDPINQRDMICRRSNDASVKYFYKFTVGPSNHHHHQYYNCYQQLACPPNRQILAYRRTTQPKRHTRSKRMPPPPPLVLLAQPLFPNFAAALEGRYRFVLAGDADAATAAEARVLLVPGLVAVTAELVDRLPALELVAATSVGLDHVDLLACRRRGLAVTNAGAAFSVDSADYAVGLVVAVLRRVAAAEAHLRRGGWATDGEYPLTTKV